MIMTETRKKIKIQEIAERANVSLSTVSRVLNSTGSVAEEKRQAVLKAIADLNYRPNLYVQGLTGGQTMTLGVLTQLISSPFFDSILRGIIDQIDNTDYLPIFVDGYWQAQREHQAIETLLDRRVDGLIVIGGCVEEDYLQQVARQIPLIIIARRVEALAPQCLYLDNVAAARMATQHLLESGHRRIAHLAGLPSHQDAMDRIEGYRQALQ
jgi:LacI family transcriptional regulator